MATNSTAQFHPVMEVKKRVITTSTRRVIKRKTKTTASAEIPLFLVVWLAAFLGTFSSAIWFIPFLVTKLHDDHIKPYLNSLRWDEDMLWQSNHTNRVPWQYDWFSCSDDKDDGPIVDAFHPLYDPPPATPAEALDSVLYFGMVVLPRVLSPPLTENLKDFVLSRVEHVSVVETIPVLTHQRRISFGLDLREDPSIAAAVHGLASNPLLSQTLEGLLGGNPAIVELSIITAHPGAKAQPWHADSNPNTIIYERHFTQVFTVLIPLQDTTHEMGATWVCPGTHRCQPPPGYCNTHGFSISTTNGTEDSHYWTAGDALLYSSDTHHRGGAHVDWDGPPRTVLILSVTSRPENHVDASGRASRWLMPYRTLPLGPVFGIRWDHWGLTWKQFQKQEYLDEFMQETDGFVRILRALGLYALDQDSGWTFAQFISFGMMNDMMGYRFMDLEAFLKSRVSPFLSGLPWFMQGRVQPTDNDYAPWPRYLSDIARNFRDAAVILNLCLAGVLLFITVAPTNNAHKKNNVDTDKNETNSQKQKKRRIGFGVFILVYLCTILFGSLAWIQTSSELSSRLGKWFRSLDKRDNNHLRVASTESLLGLKYGSTMSGSDDNSSLQDYLDKTVAADFSDVLLVDPNFIEGTTDLSRRWMNYYPGNLRWKSSIRDNAVIWLNYYGLPDVFTESVLDHVISSSESTRKKPNFLRRNQLGGWERLSKSEIRLITKEVILEWFTLPMVPQRWGAPMLQAKGPCAPPQDEPKVICRFNSAQSVCTEAIHFAAHLLVESETLLGGHETKAAMHASVDTNEVCRERLASRASE